MNYSIVGMQFRNADWLSKEDPVDPKVTLIRDPSNQYDADAIEVWIDGVHVGFVPKKENRDLAARMDKEGKPLIGKFARQSSGWPSVEVG